MAVEEKWKANLEKVAFMKQFPGLLGNWDGLDGKNHRGRHPAQGQTGSRRAGVHRWHLYHRAPDGDRSHTSWARPWQWHGRSSNPRIETAYVEYDRLVKKDKDALKSARVEKILGAIHNNLEQIPELKDRLKELVKEWK